jgi:hypothetical protein
VWVMLMPWERNKAQLARCLGVHRATLFRVMREENWEYRTELIHQVVLLHVTGVISAESRDRLCALFQRLHRQGRLPRPTSES